MSAKLSTLLGFRPPNQEKPSYQNLRRFSQDTVPPEVLPQTWDKNSCTLEGRDVQLVKEFKPSLLERIKSALKWFFNLFRINRVIQIPVYGAPTSERTLTCLKLLKNHLIENGDLKEEGIFRGSAAHEDLAKLKKALNTEQKADLKKYSPHTIAVAIKQLLTDANEPLLTNALYEEFRNALDDPEEMPIVLRQLPELNRQILVEVCDLARQVADLEKANKMSISNLAIVFQPGLMSPTDPLQILTDTPENLRVVECLLNHPDLIG